MTTRATPWDEIAEPERDYNVRRVADCGVVPLFWGKDSEGSCIFLVELQGDHARYFRRDVPHVRGIEVDLRSLGAAGKQGLILTLGQDVDRDLFFGLCRTLISSLHTAGDSRTALGMALTHIERWKAFLDSWKGGLLSPEKIRGLFGELIFLRFLYRGILDQQAAMEAWCGPESTHQDFIFGNTAVEVKAISGKERSLVRVSSEDQLESLCNCLFLMVYRLGETPDAERSRSLNAMVHLVGSELTDATAIGEFHKRLAAHGYVDMREYDRPEFSMISRHAYRVEDDFPRLARSILPDGVVQVRYRLQIEKIKQYECNPDGIGGN